MLSFTLPDNSAREYPDGVTLSDVARSIAPRFERALGGVVGSTLYDMQTALHFSGSLKFVFEKDDSALELMRHTCAHIMAQAIREVFGGVPGGKPFLAIGPVIEDGFYYDIDIDKPFTPEDLEKIEARMKEIIAGKFAMTRRVVQREEILEFFKGDIYKEELIRDLPKDAELSTYTQDTFTDLCRGPHAPDTGCVKAFKLLKVAGAYWRGDEKRPMLQRIYGTAWRKQSDLDAYLARLEEAKKRDHRHIGKELDLFSIVDNVGSGLVLWHPKGATVRRIIEDFWRKEHIDGGYDLVYSPHVGKADLWQTSGHLDFYRENMFAPMKIEEQEYFVKPMNCPFHNMIFQSRTRSYRDLPIRMGELGTVYRYERSGVLHGLLRVRGFTQDDAHIYCREDQVKDEIRRVIRFCLDMLRAFGFTEFESYVATKPKEKFVGRPEDWLIAEEALKEAAAAEGLKYEMDEGGGAFYGPKIDLKIKDALGRAWQCSTVQFDFNLPERFKLEYIGEDGKPHRPYMVHRALLGSIERFFGCLIEHYAGAFPFWLAPVQVRVMTVTDKAIPYAEGIAEGLKGNGFRVELDTGSEKIGKKIREAEVAKIPYMLVLGERDATAGTVSVRKHKEGDKGAMTIEEFLGLLRGH